MNKAIEWLSGKKTYICAALVAIGAAMVYLGVEIPEWAWAILSALGLTSVRAAVSKVSTGE